MELRFRRKHLPVVLDNLKDVIITDVDIQSIVIKKGDKTKASLHCYIRYDKVLYDPEGAKLDSRVTINIDYNNPTTGAVYELPGIDIDTIAGMRMAKLNVPEFEGNVKGRLFDRDPLLRVAFRSNGIINFVSEAIKFVEGNLKKASERASAIDKLSCIRYTHDLECLKLVKDALLMYKEEYKVDKAWQKSNTKRSSDGSKK